MKSYLRWFPMLAATAGAALHFSAATPAADAVSQRPESAECRTTRKRAKASAVDLATQAQRLRQCALKEDTNDDCAAEYRGLRAAYDEYRGAVSRVHSHCG